MNDLNVYFANGAWNVLWGDMKVTEIRGVQSLATGRMGQTINYVDVLSKDYVLGQTNSRSMESKR